MKKLAILLSLTASPALAASGPFFSLRNTDFVVTIAFLLFSGILVYFNRIHDCFWIFLSMHKGQ